jgi:hypothetical protein
MRHSEYYERATDGPDAADTWMGERRLSHLYTGIDQFVGPQHSDRVFQVCTPYIYIHMYIYIYIHI